MQNKAKALRQLFKSKSILRIMGAHNGLGAKLIEKNGFDGVWASGLEISTSYAVPDANILTMTENLHVAGEKGPKETKLDERVICHMLMA